MSVFECTGNSLPASQAEHQNSIELRQLHSPGASVGLNMQSPIINFALSGQRNLHVLMHPKPQENGPEVKERTPPSQLLTHG